MRIKNENIFRVIAGVSLVMNVLLVSYFIHERITQKNSIAAAKVATNVLFSDDYGQDDIVFLGEERMQLCNWNALMGRRDIANLAFYRNTVEDEKKRIDMLFGKEQKPSQVVLMLGMADLENGVPVNEVMNRLDLYVDTLRSVLTETEILMISPLPFVPGKSRFYKNVTKENLQAFSLMQKMYARENDIAYVDLYNEFKDNDGALKPEYDFGDEFHLSLSGYQVWMNWLKPYLRRIED